ncbi:MAG: hypothetical protein H7843_00590 [Nitrospirota bacterium]
MSERSFVKALPILLLVSILMFPATTTAQAGNAVAKENWTGQMSIVLPGIMCAENQYFRKCFNLNQTGCNNEATQAVKSCLTKYAAEIPTTLSPRDGEHWGSKISGCVYETIKSNLKTTIDSDECNDLSKRQ